MRSAAHRALSACDGARAPYVEYLQRFHSRTGQALSMCAMNTHGSQPGRRPSVGTMCANPCRWAIDMNPQRRASLDARMRLARIFSQSPLVSLRHHAPIGHFFAVPTISEVRAAWQATWSELTASWSDAGNPLDGVKPARTGSFPGLRELVSTIADAQVSPAGVLDAIAAELSTLVGNRDVNQDVSTRVKRKERHAEPH